MRLNDLIIPKLKIPPTANENDRWTLELLARKIVDADQDELKLKFFEKFNDQLTRVSRLVLFED